MDTSHVSAAACCEVLFVLTLCAGELGCAAPPRRRLRPLQVELLLLLLRAPSRDEQQRFACAAAAADARVCGVSVSLTREQMRPPSVAGHQHGLAHQGA